MKVNGRRTTLFILIALVLSACGGASAPQTQGGTTQGATASAGEANTGATASTGAAGAEAQPSAAPAAGGEKVKIALWTDPPDAGSANCFGEAAVKPFNAQSSTIEVDITEQPNSWDATRTAIAGGAGPDIVTTPGPSFAFELAKAGQLLPLDDFIQEFGWSKTFLPWALNLGKVEGKTYSIPNELETLILYYNKTLFEKNGWQPPKTLDELMALSEKIKAAGVIPFAHGNADWRPTNEWFAGEFLNHGAGPQAVYEALTGKRPWNDPVFAQPINMLNTMQQKGYFMGGLDRYYTAKADERHTAFGKGEAAMNIEGTWFLSEIDNFFGEKAGNNNDWDWVPMPSKTGDAIYDLGIGSTYSINKASQHPREVAEFLNYLFSSDVQAQLLIKCKSAPAPVRLSPDALKQLDPRDAKIREGLTQASDSGNYGYTTWTFWPPKSDVYIYEEIEKVWAKQETPEQYLDGLQKLFAQELQAGDIPPIPAR
jgi:raffinose/stachyose/melibiose transport system substrate-binding protein